MMTETTYKKSVCVDLDGVLAQYDGWKGIDHIGEPNGGAREFLKELQKLGLRVVIHTTRLNTSVNEGYHETQLHSFVTSWLDTHRMPYDEVYVGQGKPIAVAYVDDRAVHVKPGLDKSDPDTPHSFSDSFGIALRSVKHLMG